MLRGGESMTVTVEIVTNQVGQNVYRVKRNGEWVGDYINGVNTQTSGIQEALDYAAQIGDAVELGPGTFYVSATILLPDIYGVSLRGASDLLTTIEQAPGFSGSIMRWGNTSAAHQYFYFGHFHLVGNAGGQSVWLMDLSQTELSANGLLEHIRVDHNNVGGIRLDGNEDTLTVALSVDNSTGMVGISWYVPNGAGWDIGSDFISGAYIQGQKFDFYGTVFGADQYLTLVPAPQPSIYNFWGAYWNYSSSYPTMINIEGMANTSNTMYLNFVGCMINPSTLAIHDPIFYNPTTTTVTVYARFVNSMLQSSSGATLFGSYITGYAEIDDTVGSLYPLTINNTPISSPAIAPSGNATENSYPFPVIVYLSGGSATQVKISKYSNPNNDYVIWSAPSDTAIPFMSVRLDPFDLIIITYSTAPTWTWVPA
jgi:hypothetical protein